MPKPTTSAPDGDSRKALQDRAREASRPAAPAAPGRWPFPAGSVGGATADRGADDSRNHHNSESVE